MNRDAGTALTPRATRVATWAFSVGVIVLGFAVSFGRSAAIGRPSAEPTYDDVVYALAGSGNASMLQSSGVRSFGGYLLHHPPHAPVTEGIATIAALLGGPSVLRLYFLNALFMTGLIVVLARVVLRAGWPATLMAAGVALASPLGFFVLDQFRPDPSYVLGLGILAGVCSRFAVRPAPDPRRMAMWCGFGSALLLYLKPSFFVLTGVSVIALLAWTMLVWRPAVPGKAVRLRFVGRAGTWFLAASAPFWVLVFPAAYQYVVGNKFEAASSVWNTTDPARALQNSMMQASDVLGWMPRLAIWVAVVSVIAALARRRPRWLLRSTAFLTVGLVTMPAVALARETHVFYGSVPVFMLVLASVAACNDVFVRGWWAERRTASSTEPDRAGVPASRIRLGVAAGATVAGLLVVAFAGQTPPIVAADLRSPLSLNQRVLTAVVDACSTDPLCDAQYTSAGTLPPLLVPFAADVNADSLDWQAVVGGWSGRVQRIDLFEGIEAALAAAKSARFVVTLGPAANDVNAALPFNGFQAALADRLVADGAWKRVPIPVVGDRYLLFQQR